MSLKTLGENASKALASERAASNQLQGMVKDSLVEYEANKLADMRAYTAPIRVNFETRLSNMETAISNAITQMLWILLMILQPF